MSNTYALLCTFCTTETLDETVKKIISTYTIAFDSLYVLENVENPNILCITYNADTSKEINGGIPESTISLHRKKNYNVLYTINALNAVIKELNHGILDREFKIPWENYSNSILVTAYGKLKRIDTKLNKIIKVEELLTNIKK